MNRFRRLSHSRIAIYAMIGLLFAGCTTVRSLPLSRTDEDCYMRDLTIPVKGIPITLKVPTHVDIEIVETIFLENVADASADFVELKPVPLSPGRRSLEINTTRIDSEKVFTVDWVRPAAGTLEYGAKLSDEQYFEKLTGKITDETIKQVAASLQVVSTLGAKKTSAQSPFSQVLTIRRTVAYQRFDLNAPNFEQQVLGFVETHLNQCAPQCPATLLPSEEGSEYLPLVK